MGISAMSIPIKRLPISRLIIDDDLRMTAPHGIQTNRIQCYTPGSKVYINNASIYGNDIDAEIAGRTFTCTDSTTMIYDWSTILPDVAHITESDYAPIPDYPPVGSYPHMVKVPGGMISGAFRLQFIAYTNNATATVYIRAYNLTTGMLIGSEQSVTGLSATAKYCTLTLGTGVSVGDAITLYGKVTSGYDGRIASPTIRGTPTYAIKPGTVSWV